MGDYILTDQGPPTLVLTEQGQPDIVIAEPQQPAVILTDGTSTAVLLSDTTTDALILTNTAPEAVVLAQIGPSNCVLTEQIQGPPGSAFMGITGTGFPYVISGVLQGAAISVPLNGGSNYVTGVLPIANGGTGLSSVGTTGYLLASTGSALEYIAPPVSGIDQLHGDVLAGPGTGNQQATVVGLQMNPVSSATPSDTQILTWVGSTSLWTPQTIAGDISAANSGADLDLTVESIQGVVISGTPAGGNTLGATNSSAATWSALNLAGGSTYVTGALPIANLAPGTSAQVLMSNATPATTWTTFAGDMTVGATGTTTVGKIHGATVPVAGSLTVGNGLYVSGSSALSYSALNLAGGSGWITGLLPLANLTYGTAGQYLLTNSGASAPVWTSMSGDVESSTSTVGLTTVLAIHGATVPMAGSLTIGNGLHVSGSSALTYEPLNLAGGSAWVIGDLPVTNIAPGTAGQYLITNTTPAAAWITLTGDVQAMTVTPGENYIVGISGIDGTAGVVTLGDSSHDLLLTQTGTANLSIIASANFTLEAAAASALIFELGSYTVLTVTDSGGDSTFTLNTPITTITQGAGGSSMTLSSANGIGSASTSTSGASLYITGGAAAKATSGTSGGAVGSTITVTSGEGAAGEGSNQNGGNSGDIVLLIGAPGAATGTGNPGVYGTIRLEVGDAEAILVTEGAGGGGTSLVTITSLAAGLVYSDSSGDLQNVLNSSGTNGEVLTLSGGVPVWGPNSGTSVTGTGLWYSASGTLNSAAITLTGDVSQGSLSSNNLAITVAKIQGNTVTSGALVKGDFLMATSTSNWAATALSGDVSASASTVGLTTVVGIQGNTVTSGSLTKGDLFIATTTSNWGGTAVTGDVAFSATTPGLTVVDAINGSTVPAGGSLTIGNTLHVTGSSALGYGALNLAGGSGYVTGNLPVTNIAPSATTGYILTTTSGGSTVAWAANSGTTVTGTGLWYSASGTLNSAAITLTGDVSQGSLSSNNLAITVAKIQGNTVASGALVKGDFMMATSTSNWAATALSGDVSASASTVGLTTVTGIQGNTVTSGALVAGDVLLATSTTNWAATAFSGDVSLGSTGATHVLAITGSGGTAGTINIGDGTHNLAFIQPTSLQSTPPTLTISSATGYSAASASGAGGAFNLTAGSAVQASSGTAAGGAGAAMTLTTGSGAAGEGSNQNGGNGGNFVINTGAGGAKTGSGTAGTNGTISLEIAGTPYLTIGTSGVVTLGGLGAGVVLSDSSGDLSNLADGTNGYVLTMVSSAPAWAAATGTTVTWAADLASSTSTDQYVASISGSGGSGGNVPFNANTLGWEPTQTTPGIYQIAANSTSAGSGAAGYNFYLNAMAGQAATGASHNGGAGGNLTLSSGAGGTSGSATPGAAGELNFALGATPELVMDSGVTTASTITFNWGDGTNNIAWVTPTSLQSSPPAFTFTGAAGYAAASVSGAGMAMTIAAGAGTVASSGTSVGGAGGAMSIKAGNGAAGLGGTSEGGAGGNLLFYGGNGGASISSSANSAGGAIVFQAGTAGTGGGGAVGTDGYIQFENSTIMLTLGLGRGLGLHAGSVSLSTGSITLAVATANNPVIDFGTSSLTGNCTVVFPTPQVGCTWIIDASDVTFNGHTISIETNSQLMSTTLSAAAVWLINYNHAGRFKATVLSTS